MNRLYLRIFLGFWLVIILIICTGALINQQVDQARRDDASQQERAAQVQDRLISPAREALETGGQAALRDWQARSRRELRRMELYILDESGQDLLTQEVNPRARRVHRRWQVQGHPPRGPRPGQFVETLTHPDTGTTYLLILSRPPVPLHLRMFGPLGPGGLIALAILISGLICFWLARTITRPIWQLRRAGQALGQGQLGVRLDEPLARRRDELGDLARDFNRMAERLEKLVGAQRQLLRDVSHELRSPLARLQVSLTLAADARDEESRNRYLAGIDRDAGRLNHLIGEILDYSRLAEGSAATPQPMDLAELLEDIAASANLEGRPRNIRTRLNGPHTCPLTADEELLHRAIENVVRNALRHSPDDGTVDLQLDCREAEGIIRVEIRDEGPGIPEASLETIFEPFVRLTSERSESGPGGGVGLAIAREAIRRHGGSIRAANRPEGGLTVRIELPRDNS